jgi:hypothetical protein
VWNVFLSMVRVIVAAPSSSGVSYSCVSARRTVRDLYYVLTTIDVADVYVSRYLFFRSPIDTIIYIELFTCIAQAAPIKQFWNFFMSTFSTRLVWIHTTHYLLMNRYHRLSNEQLQIQYKTMVIQHDMIINLKKNR